MKLSRDYGLPLYYAGKKEKLAFCKALSKGSTVPEPVVRFALFGSGLSEDTPGANRNSILLHTLGELVFSVDDDTVCRMGQAIDVSSASLRFGNESEHGEHWFFKDRRAALSAGIRRNTDILAEHERYLGKLVSSLLIDVQGNCAGLSGMCAHLYQSLLLNKASVKITLNGVVGDCGTHDNRWVLLCNDQNTRARIDSEAAYRSALSSREVIRQVTADPSVPT